MVGKYRKDNMEKYKILKVDSEELVLLKLAVANEIITIKKNLEKLKGYDNNIDYIELENKYNQYMKLSKILDYLER